MNKYIFETFNGEIIEINGYGWEFNPAGYGYTTIFKNPNNQKSDNDEFLCGGRILSINGDTDIDKYLAHKVYLVMYFENGFTGKLEPAFRHEIKSEDKDFYYYEGYKKIVKVNKQSMKDDGNYIYKLKQW